MTTIRTARLLLMERAPLFESGLEEGIAGGGLTVKAPTKALSPAALEFFASERRIGLPERAPCVLRQRRDVVPAKQIWTCVPLNVLSVRLKGVDPHAVDAV